MLECRKNIRGEFYRVPTSNLVTFVLFIGLINECFFDGFGNIPPQNSAPFRNCDLNNIVAACFVELISHCFENELIIIACVFAYSATGCVTWT
jgi:hypothetical protein